MATTIRDEATHVNGQITEEAKSVYEPGIGQIEPSSNVIAHDQLRPEPSVLLPVTPDVLAPDGSEVRILARTDRASMAQFRLAPRQVTIGVVHRTVDEVWFVTGGGGAIWRCPDGRPDLGLEETLAPGVSVAIPVGTHFQFRSAADSALDIVGVTVPPWPGMDEAVVSTLAPWQPTVGQSIVP